MPGSKDIIFKNLITLQNILHSVRSTKQEQEAMEKITKQRTSWNQMCLLKIKIFSKNEVIEYKRKYKGNREFI